jgi:hypothetical protein
MDCVICHDIFDDPIFCADGFAYCRVCIGRWVDHSSLTWKSPTSNLEIAFPALLIRDFQRNVQALELKQMKLEKDLNLTDDQSRKMMLLATATHCGLSISSQQQEIQVLSGSCKDADPFYLLELSYRNSRCHTMSDFQIETLIEEDSRNFAHPRIKVEVLEYLAKKNDSENLLHHIKTRLSVPDAIQIQPRLLETYGLSSQGPVFCIREDHADLRTEVLQSRLKDFNHHSSGYSKHWKL